MYGSSRLGIWKWDTIVPSAAPVVNESPIHDSLLFGSRTYELSNHLGNVLATINDKKIGVTSNDSTVDYYTTEVLSQNDYYQFGMMMGRNYKIDTYRYGFNGKENDNEVKGGDGTQQDYGMRIYDPRVGRFLSVDPISQEYPMLTPFQFASNTPIAAVDLDGEEAKIVNVNHFEFYDSKGRLQVTKTTEVESNVQTAGLIINKIKRWTTGENKTGTSYRHSKTIDRISPDGKVTSQTTQMFEIYVPGKNDTRAGGLYFVSENGGASGRGGETDGEPIKIDLLVKVLGGFPKGNLDTEISPFAHSGDEIAKLLKLVDHLKSDKTWAVKAEKAFSAIKAIINFNKSGQQVGQAVDEYLKQQQKSSENDAVKFSKKGTVYHDEDLKANIERTSDTTGQLTTKEAKDTLRKHQ